MDNRQLSVTVCGIVAGVIVAGGILSFGADARLTGSLTDVAYRAGTVDIDTGSARRRVIGEQEIKATPEYVPVYPSVKDENAVEPVSAPVVDEAACAVAREVVAELKDAHDKAVPERIANRKARKVFQDAVDAVLAARCGEAPAKKKVRAVRVDNDCEQYPEATARFVECKDSERRGVTYP